MPNSTTPSLDEQIACAERELKMRHRVYDRRVNDGSMPEDKATHEKACMTAIIASLKEYQRLKGETLL
jgi:hypothetical protein